MITVALMSTVAVGAWLSGLFDKPIEKRSADVGLTTTGTRPPETIATVPVVNKKPDGQGTRPSETKQPALPVNVLATSTGLKLVRVKPGNFTMGSDEGPDEAPPHLVTISRAFYLGETEVTQGQYQQIKGSNPSQFHGSDSLPVDSVSWFDAVEYCNALSEKEGLPTYYKSVGSAASRTVTIPILDGTGYRLPTEAEWEYACRAGLSTKYSFGDDPAAVSEFAWFDGNSEKSAHPVGLKSANGFGLYDMTGNLREWCWDRYNADEYKKRADKDPRGPEEGFGEVLHVHRGGSWDSTAPLLRSSARGKLKPNIGGEFFGFRLARNVPDAVN